MTKQCSRNAYKKKTSSIIYCHIYTIKIEIERYINNIFGHNMLQQDVKTSPFNPEPVESEKYHKDNNYRDVPK